MVTLIRFDFRFEGAGMVRISLEALTEAFDLRGSPVPRRPTQFVTNVGPSKRRRDPKFPSTEPGPGQFRLCWTERCRALTAHLELARSLTWGHLSCLNKRCNFNCSAFKFGFWAASVTARLPPCEEQREKPEHGWKPFRALCSGAAGRLSLTVSSTRFYTPFYNPCWIYFTRSRLLAVEGVILLQN